MRYVVIVVLLFAAFYSQNIPAITTGSFVNTCDNLSSFLSANENWWNSNIEPREIDDLENCVSYIDGVYESAYILGQDPDISECFPERRKFMEAVIDLRERLESNRIELSEFRNEDFSSFIILKLDTLCSSDSDDSASDPESK